MNQFILIVTVIILTTVVVRVGLFLKFKIELKKGKIRLHKLKEFRRFAWYNVFGLFVSIFSGVVFYKIHDSYDFLIGWSAIGLSNFTNIFIVPQNYILTDKNGLKRSYIGRKYLWDKLSINQAETKFTIAQGKKSLNFEFENKNDLESFRKHILFK